MRIGLTGGIGSGKTTVANLFSDRGIDIIDADVIVHQLSQPGQPTFDAIVHHFGSQVLMDDGALNRSWLREQTFSHPEDKKTLEGILHPAVRATMQAFVATVTSPYCLLAVPLLIETGFTNITDRVLVVMASEEIRSQRVRLRSGLTSDQIKAIMASQATDGERQDAADDVITNEGTLESLQRQVEELDVKYRELVGGTPPSR